MASYGVTHAYVPTREAYTQRCNWRQLHFCMRGWDIQGGKGASKEGGGLRAGGYRATPAPKLHRGNRMRDLGKAACGPHRLWLTCKNGVRCASAMCKAIQISKELRLAVQCMVLYLHGTEVMGSHGCMPEALHAWLEGPCDAECRAGEWSNTGLAISRCWRFMVAVARPLGG